MASYRIEIAPAALRELKKLAQGVREQIAPDIDALATEPRPSGVVKLEGKSDFYRFRSGDYRIVYSIQDEALIVLVVKVANRREVYKNRR